MKAMLTRALSLVFAGGLLLLIRAAALLFSPFRLGRLLQTVSIPRMQQHLARTALTVIGLAVGVASLLAVLLVNRSILTGATATVEDIAGKADLQVSAGTTGLDEVLLETVASTPGVERAVPVVQQMVPISGPKGGGERLLMLGLDLLAEDDSHFREYGDDDLAAVRRDPIAFVNSPENIILGRDIADRLGYKVGDKVPLLTSSGVKSFEIWGLLQDTRMARAFGGAVAIMYYPAMQVAFDRGHNIDRIDIVATKDKPVTQVAEAVRASLGASGVSVGPPAQKSQQLADMLQGLRGGLQFASLIALFVGAFLVQNTMAINIVQRKREIGTLRALGATSRQILGWLLMEGLLIGIVGSALGVAAGIGLARGLLVEVTRTLEETYSQLALSEVSPDPVFILTGFGVGTLATILATALPAWNAGRVSPISNLRTSGLSSTGPMNARFTWIEAAGLCLAALSFAVPLIPRISETAAGGFLMLTVGLLGSVLLLPRVLMISKSLFEKASIRWFGAAALLASGNLTRDVLRTARTSGALMTSTGMIVTIGIFVTSFHDSTSRWMERGSQGDLYVTSGARMSGLGFRNAPFAESFRAELGAIPEVQRVRASRVVELPFQGQPLRVIAMELSQYGDGSAPLEVLEGGSLDDVIARMRAGSVVISENLARHFKLAVGSRIRLPVAGGAREFDVAAVIVDYSSEVGTVRLDRAYFVEAWKDDRVDTFELDLRGGVDPDAVRTAISRKYGDSHDLFVLTSREQRAEYRRLTDRIFSLLRALELVAIFVAVIGIANAQSANVLDRIHEIGLLRAVGMLKWQTTQLMIVEAALISLVGVLLGIALGTQGGRIVLSHVNLVQSGWRFQYVFPYLESLGAGLLIVILSCLATLYPARHASGLRVTEALGRE